MLRCILLPLLAVQPCTQPKAPPAAAVITVKDSGVKPIPQAANSWPGFLQRLPVVQQPVVDFSGQPVAHQQKAIGVIPFDVGNRDLQQCADALIRLRAEYLFGQRRFSELSFRFTSGHPYSFLSYCAGQRPVVRGQSLRFTNGAACTPSQTALRKYLDVVYTYAGTISLYRDLKKQDHLEIGTIIITPGSPGHCFIIIDEGLTASGEKRYKLAEGYTPAQSIYVLRNGAQGPWHALGAGTITTASYQFKQYGLRSFE